MRQLYGSHVPWVLDTVYVHRGDVDLDLVREPCDVQAVHIHL